MELKKASFFKCSFQEYRLLTIGAHHLKCAPLNASIVFFSYIFLKNRNKKIKNPYKSMPNFFWHVNCFNLRRMQISFISNTVNVDWNKTKIISKVI